MLALGSAISSSLIYLAPYNPAKIIAGPQAPLEQVREIENSLGLDESPVVHFFTWIGGAFHGDFGKSWALQPQEPVSSLIWERLPRTLTLVGLAIIFSVVVGIPLGILFSLKRGKWIDRLGLGGWLLIVGIPIIWVGLLAVLVFGVWLGWPPATGGGVGIEYILIPSLLLSIPQGAIIARLTRSKVLELSKRESSGRKKAELNQESLIHVIVRTFTVIIPKRLPLLLGIALPLETIFGWSGMGPLMIQAINGDDFLVIQGSLWIFIVIVIVANLVGGITYTCYSRYVRGR